MVKGFKATLFAGCITLGAFAPAFAAAPVISGLPDIQIGDDEDSSSSDSNLFVFSDAFSFDAYVSDADTADSALKWSFGEYTNPDLAGPEYTINGVGPINNGDAAIAAEQDAGFPNASSPGANQIDVNDQATFRDILFSPTSGTAPFPDPSPADAAAAAAGKALRFYVADPEGNVGFQDTLIRTVDNNSDFATDSNGYQELVRDTDFTNGWIKSGIPVDEASATSATAGQLDITVTPAAARYRIVGWENKALLPYDSVGNTKFVRGKFFINASNAFSAPINEVPGFRLRVTHEGAVNGAIHYEYAQTGYSAPPQEPAYALFNNAALETYSKWLRPSDQVSTPSLYRVDLDPIDVPAAAGSNIGALMESYAIPDPANGTLSLKEVVLATYDAKTDADADATLLYEYNRATGLAGGAGGAKSIATSGAFNAEPDFQPGRRQDLTFTTSLTAPGFVNFADQGASGILADSDSVPQNVYGIGLLNVSQTDNASKVRISPDKLYRTRFYATAPVPTDSDLPAVESQGNLRFRFQTVGLTQSYLLDMSTVAGFSLGAKGDAIAAQALPGIGGQNPDQDAALDTVGEHGGWYSVIASSPLDTDGIRVDNGNDFGDLGSQPGPGSASASNRDVVVGVDIIQIPNTIKVSDTFTLPFGRPNRSVVRFAAIKVYEYPAIDDGGYDY